MTLPREPREGDVGGESEIDADRDAPEEPASRGGPRPEAVPEAGPEAVPEAGPEAVPDEPAGASAPVDPWAEITAQRDEYLDALRRVQADFENFRKQSIRRQTDSLERAGQHLATALLPVLDAMDLALVHHGAADPEDGSAVEGETRPANAAGGLGQVSSMLFDVLSKEGLERVGKVGELFDPTVHDAVAREEHGEVPTVAEVMRSGYRWKGRLVRPAMVKVRG